MKNNLFFFIFLFTVSISLTRCKKEGIGTDTPRKDLENARQTASNRTGDLAALDFEAELNTDFTSTQYRKDISVYEEISFSETGYFSETRQSEIRNLIQNMITSRQGQKPFYVDIDSKNKKVVVAFAQEKVEGGNINDALNWEGNSFENLMASQINCGYPIIFPTDISVRPNGGIPDAFCASGTFCDDTPDSGCGGLGRIAKKAKGSIPLPFGIESFSDIMEIGLLGSSISGTLGSVADGVIEKSTPNLWYRSLPGVQHPLCFTHVELQDYYCRVWDELFSVLPPGYIVLDLQSASIAPPVFPSNEFQWYVRFKVGRPVYKPGGGGPK